MAQKDIEDQVKAAVVADTSEELAKKAPAKAVKADEPADEAPYPSQADLDAIKAGQYRNRALASK